MAVRTPQCPQTTCDIHLGVQRLDCRGLHVGRQLCVTPCHEVWLFSWFFNNFVLSSLNICLTLMNANLAGLRREGKEPVALAAAAR